MPAHPSWYQHGQGSGFGVRPLLIAVNGLPRDFYSWALVTPLHMFVCIGSQDGVRLWWCLRSNLDFVTFGSGDNPRNVCRRLSLVPTDQMMGKVGLLEFNRLQCDIPQCYSFDQPDDFMLCFWPDYIMFFHCHFPLIADITIHMLVTARLQSLL